MMVILLIGTGAVFALLFILNSLLRAAQGREKIGFFETLLAFLGLILPLLALVNNNASEQPLPLVNSVAIGIAAVVIVAGIVTVLIELQQRGRKLSQRRGLLGIGVGLLLIAATFITPAASRLMTLSSFATVAGASRSGAETEGIVNVANTAAQPSGGGEPGAALQILMEETGLDSSELSTRLDAGETIASIVEDTGGDLDRVITGITEIMRQRAKEAAGSNPQAALMLNNLENIVAQAVNGQLPQAAYDRLLGNLFSAEALTPTEGAIAEPTLEEQVAAAPTEIPPSILQMSATPTRLPSATPTPTNTPYILVSPTPNAASGTAESSVAQPSDCLAVVNSNLNLRTGPGMDHTLVLTIPFSTTLHVSGRNEEATWWFVSYQSETGWVSGDFLTLGHACADLPVRQVAQE